MVTDGGMLDLTWKEHLTNNAVALLCMFIVDRALLAPFVASRVEKHRSRLLARWFLIHSVSNFFVCLSALNSVRNVLSDPAHCMDGRLYSNTGFFGDSSVWPLTIINSVHVYHMVGGFGLSAADYFHHLLFVPALGGPGQIYSFGALANWQAFYISGLPGGLDYFMLGLQKCGLLDPMTEKRVNANLNVWLRVPGILSTTTLVYVGLIEGSVQAPWWNFLLQLTLPGYNALYFCKQAVANYAVHYMLNLLGQDELIQERIEQRTSATTGTEVMQWKDALAVPQRGS